MPTKAHTPLDFATLLHAREPLYHAHQRRCYSLYPKGSLITMQDTDVHNNTKFCEMLIPLHSLQGADLRSGHKVHRKEFSKPVPLLESNELLLQVEQDCTSRPRVT
eukprot:Blabericola_migrator_1__8212@NODE_424_length_8630_cov_20_263342_g335_i0_p5_GENE_NODE_424_length_8630_cov_20_263342_g335_i0NODE_424_length_8630_cov_20_263342_g335_i0_p5_ORF_typecomplete_len106_score0_97DUF4789/PF16033_5/0_14_NODE_424_length_8630_cov_20_263342_g335_i069647281